jgi:large subunit ribosomal protein L25
MAGIVLQVEERSNTGTGAARAVRREEKIPGILYGGSQDAAPVQLQSKEVNKAIRSGKFISHLVEINLGGKKQPVIPRAIQYHPVTDAPIHVDLYRVDENTVINVAVPVRFINQEASPGMKRGGVLNIVSHTVEVLTPATKIPEEFVIDLTGMEIGAVMHASAIELPQGVKLRTKDRDFTIASLSGRAAEEEAKAEGADGEAAAEGDAAKAGDAKAAPAAKGAAPAAKAAPKKD